MKKGFLTVVVVASLLICSATSTQAALVGSYSFDEGAGTTVGDASGNGNNGTIANLRADTWATGHTGGGMYFPGIKGSGATYVNLGNPGSFQLTSAFTFSAWVHCTAPNTDAPILAKEGPTGGISYWFGVFYNGFGTLVDHNGIQSWDVQARNVPGSDWDQWHHLAATWDGATLNQYLDGNLVDTRGVSGSLFNTSESLTIGANSGYTYEGHVWSTAFTGTLDDIHIYDTALSASGINADMYSAVPAPAAVWLLGSAVAAWVGAMRRRKNVKPANRHG